MPDTAQLCAANGERAELLRRRVGNIVVVRVCVGFHPELVGPEAVDDVERRDVELDGGVVGDNQLIGLEPAEGRIPVGEFPLLPNNLNWEHGLRRRSPDGARTLAASGSTGLDELIRAEAGKKEHDHARGQDPSQLNAEMATCIGASNGLGTTTRCPPHHDDVDEVDPDAQQDRQGDHEEHVEVELSPLGCVRHRPGRNMRTGIHVEERIQDGREDDPDGDQAPPMVSLILRRRRPLRRGQGGPVVLGVAHVTTFMKPPMYPSVDIGPPLPYR